MKDISDAADLIATARDTLMNELLPTLVKEQRYAGLMIANAMAIALRESRSGATAAGADMERIRVLLAGVRSQAPPPAAGGADELRSLQRQLCGAIREGSFDREGAAALSAHLARTAADWVAISNPKALRTERAA